MKKINIIFVSCLVLISCSKNLLSSTSQIEPDDDYYSQALNALNQKDYDSTVSIITAQITASGQATSKVRELLASAYAGKCGLNLLDYTDKLATQTAGSGLLIMMSPFVQASVAEPEFCKQALQTLELIGTTSSRTVNQNLFASVTGMVLLGTALRTSADLSPSLGDSVADVDLCSAVTDAQIDNMILGFGYFNKNFTAVSSALIGSFANTNFGVASTACVSAVGAAGCNIINAADITPAMRTSFRDLANTSDYGIGLFSTGGNQALIPSACP